MNSPRHPLFALLLCGLLLLIPNAPAQAGSATWNLNPTSSDWNTAANWTPATVPNGPDDVATFGSSDKLAIALSDNVNVGEIVFDPGASAYGITSTSDNHLTIGGAGITNNSGVTQSFATVREQTSGYGEIVLMNSARAGISTAYAIGTPTNTSTGSANTDMFFMDSSSADHGTFVTETSGVYFTDSAAADHATFLNAEGADPGGMLWFEDQSTAGSAMITNEGATSADSAPGNTHFDGYATAESATLIAESGSSGGAGGTITFLQGSTGGESNVMAFGGSEGGSGAIIFFYQDSTGGAARVAVFDSASLDISSHHASSGVTVGSLEGSGLVSLGANTLAVGSNGLSTTFSGLLQDSGRGGSLAKIGNGILALTNANTYSGGTLVKRGGLLINNTIGSGTGNGPVQVASGTLGGKGIIAGAVIVGTGGDKNATLAPGPDGVGLITIQSTLAFGSNATYKWNIQPTALKADEVVAQGVTIDSGALFSISGRGDATLPLRTVFTVISNTAATPTIGTFSNLADGSTVTVGSNTFQANYEGGDGNDLTLTVVP
jgi:autotransporter-associated beta strand protein